MSEYIGLEPSAPTGEGEANAEGQEVPDRKLIGELLGILAHDLRNPLSALNSNLGYLGSVLMGTDPDASEAIEDGVVSCDGLSHIIDNVDLFGQMLRGEVKVRSVAVPVQAIVGAAVESCQSAAKSHGLSISATDSSEHLHLMIEASRDLAARALANLIRNSIQHAPTGSTVAVGVHEGPAGSVVVRVTDEGSSLGVSGTSAFTAMGQLHAKANLNSRYSRGLGLYSAALAASLCKASLQARDLPGGSCFELRFAASS